MEYVKKIIGFVIGFAVVSGIFYFVRGGDKLKAFEPYHSEEGRFSVLFPGEPESKTEQVETPVGTLEFVMCSAGSKKTGFVVAYVDYSQEVMMSNPFWEISPIQEFQNQSCKLLRLGLYYQHTSCGVHYCDQPTARY